MRSGRRVAEAARQLREAGFVYIGLLIFLAVIAIGLDAVSEVWHQSAQRDREEELLFIGNQFREAITRYYTTSPRGQPNFPMQLEDLLEDSRFQDAPHHHLRKLYADPMTGKADWNLVTLPGGGIVGVSSRSDDAPLKVDGFRLRDAIFKEQAHYSDWVFRSALPAANPQLGFKPGSYGTTPGGPALPQGPIRGPQGGQGGRPAGPGFK